MDEKLKKYLEEHREVFDDEEPSRKVWDNIQKNIDHSQATNDPAIWWKVAAVFLFALSTVLLFDRLNSDRTIRDVAVATPIVYNQGLTGIRSFYATIIEQKKIELEDYVEDDPLLFDSFEKDIADLDSTYLELEREYRDSRNDRIVEAMINNLKTKVEVLSRYLNTMDKLKIREEKYKNEESA